MNTDGSPTPQPNGSPSIIPAAQPASATATPTPPSAGAAAPTPAPRAQPQPPLPHQQNPIMTTMAPAAVPSPITPLTPQQATPTTPIIPGAATPTPPVAAGAGAASAPANVAASATAAPSSAVASSSSAPNVASTSAAANATGGPATASSSSTAAAAGATDPATGPDGDTEMKQEPEDEDANAHLFAARREEELARRDRSLAEFLSMLDGYKPLIPEEVTEYYLQRAGFECSDPRLKRLLSLSAQKFVSDLSRDAFHFAKLRVNGTTAGRGRPAAGVDRNRVVLTMDDLSLALGEHGVNVKKPDYYL